MTRLKKRYAFGALAATTCLASWLFLGVFRDREWSELHVFLKHRPTFKVMFHAPRGEADPSNTPGREGYLSPEEETEELAYVEFVEAHEGYRRSLAIPVLR